MTCWMRRFVVSETGRLPLSAYETVLRDTPARLAISPMFIVLLATDVATMVEPIR
jgi:hypothetical protein